MPEYCQLYSSNFEEQLPENLFKNRVYCDFLCYQYCHNTGFRKRLTSTCPIIFLNLVLVELSEDIA
jgi:hypothetical protein